MGYYFLIMWQRHIGGTLYTVHSTLHNHNNDKAQRLWIVMENQTSIDFKSSFNEALNTTTMIVSYSF